MDEDFKEIFFFNFFVFIQTSSESKFNCNEIPILINLRVCTNILYNKFKARKPSGLF